MDRADVDRAGNLLPVHGMDGTYPEELKGKIREALPFLDDECGSSESDAG